MKRIGIAFISVGFSILFSLGITLAIGGKNSSNLFPSAQSAPSDLRADGDPAPPFPRKRLSLIRTSESMVIADGDPAPPFPKRPIKRLPIGLNSGFGMLSTLTAAEGKLA
jgi:hypothetical protein